VTDINNDLVGIGMKRAGIPFVIRPGRTELFPGIPWMHPARVNNAGTIAGEGWLDQGLVNGLFVVHSNGSGSTPFAGPLTIPRVAQFTDSGLMLIFSIVRIPFCTQRRSPFFDARFYFGWNVSV
jgi:hypothetical protein